MHRTGSRKPRYDLATAARFQDAKTNYFRIRRREVGSTTTPRSGCRRRPATRSLKSCREGRLDQEEHRAVRGNSAYSITPHEKAAEPRLIASWTPSLTIGMRSIGTTDRVRVPSVQRALNAQREVYRRTLADRPWEACSCRTCREGGIESVIFRSSNRNKRRGIHNLHVFYKHLTKNRAAA